MSESKSPPTGIFVLMTLTNILINMDHGILPACTKQLRRDFNMDEAQLGVMGSMVYLGIVVTGFFAGWLYQKFNSKLLMMLSLMCLQMCLLLFVLSSQAKFAYISRFLTGACQVFLLVYYPVWIDKFGQHRRTAWLTVLQICVPIGIFIGYGITSVITSFLLDWKVSFYIQISVVALFIAACAFVPNTVLDCRRDPNEQQDGSLLQDQEEAVDHSKKYQICVMLKELCKSKMYAIGTLTMAVILFVSTGIQFWLTDYFINQMGFEQEGVNIAYAVISITGPTLGCAFGGWVIDRIGGYEHQNTVFYIWGFSCIAIAAAVCIPFFESFYLLTCLLWVVLFFGGAMMPGLTGIMMTSVVPYLRAFGNSNGEIIKNVFGYLPAPFLYGFINAQLHNRAGIKFLMFWGLWAPFLLGLGSLIKWNQIIKRKKNQITYYDQPLPIKETEKEQEKIDNQPKYII